MPTEHPAPPRLFRIEYKATRSRRVARFFVKVPYGVYKDGLYLLNEVLTRAQLQGEIEWFRVGVAKPGEITAEVRTSLTRWPQALAASVARTKVAFE